MNTADCPGCGLTVPVVRLLDGWRRIAMHADPTLITAIPRPCGVSHALVIGGGFEGVFLPKLTQRGGA